jgi:hypothetical protein
MFTPPQTPGHHVNGSTSSVPGIVPAAIKRESNASSVSNDSSSLATGNVAAGVKRGSTASEIGGGEDAGVGKKRRIAPTPVVPGGSGQGPSDSAGSGGAAA